MGIEIERKFLVNQIPSNTSHGLAICQGYMLNQKNKVVRIRTIRNKGGNKGFLTIKGKTIHAQRSEFEYEIPLDDARQMLDLFCEKPVVEKTRFKINFKGFEWEIDLFAGKNKGLIVAEIELDQVNQFFEKPPWAGEEVTHDPRYYNSNLIIHPYSTW
jgi:adenylate cyclase